MGTTTCLRHARLVPVRPASAFGELAPLAAHLMAHPVGPRVVAVPIPADRDYLTVPEAADMLGVSLVTMRRLTGPSASPGMRVPSHRIGRSVRILRRDLDSLRQAPAVADDVDDFIARAVRG